MSPDTATPTYEPESYCLLKLSSTQKQLSLADTGLRSAQIHSPSSQRCSHYIPDAGAAPTGPLGPARVLAFPQDVLYTLCLPPPRVSPSPFPHAAPLPELGQTAPSSRVSSCPRRSLALLRSPRAVYRWLLGEATPSMLIILRCVHASHLAASSQHTGSISDLSSAHS